MFLYKTFWSKGAGEIWTLFPTIDTIILGRRTYDWVLKEIGASHYDNGERNVYVITRTERPTVGKTTFYTGNLTELVQQLKSENGKTSIVTVEQK